MPTSRQLPRRLAPCESAANDMYGVQIMSRHALRIAARCRFHGPGPHLQAVSSFLLATAAGCSANPTPQEQPRVSPDQAWVQGACSPESFDATGWPQYRLGDLLISVPSRYRVSHTIPYTVLFRNANATLTLTLHRNARYLFDTANRPRPGQVWCGTHYGGYGAEVISWHEGFVFGVAARIEATWGGQDEGKWLYAVVTTSHLDDARRLRHALRSIIAVQDTITSAAR
ncbi:MAG TPA: hypothetical protein VF981_04390 [Gemmatimonadaceae bacterium]